MSELTPDEREALGERLMLTMTCYHGTDYFGTGAVCETCWANVQCIGRIVERRLAEQREQIAQAIEAEATHEGVRAQRVVKMCARIARGGTA